MTKDSHIATLSRLLFQGYDYGDISTPKSDLAPLNSDLEYVSNLSSQELVQFLASANTHHVLVRALQALEPAAVSRSNARIAEWCHTELDRERQRITTAIDLLVTVCDVLNAGGCPVVVIKSLDHWPDLGSDLDLYTPAYPDTVRDVMKSTFRATLEDRSWGDRLANKWNFSVPGLPELIEIHVQYLGQTGEHKALAHRVVQRSQLRQVGRHVFRVPAPEERILISTLQRMYRHFYFRLCDMVDVAKLLQEKQVDFAELRRAADDGGIWAGAATFLHLVANYTSTYGRSIDLPESVRAAAYSPEMGVHLRGDFLRVPLLPSAGLYASQLLSAGLNRDLRALCRLPLLPPLAITALLAFRLTGTDKGIW